VKARAQNLLADIQKEMAEEERPPEPGATVQTPPLTGLQTEVPPEPPTEPPAEPAAYGGTCGGKRRTSNVE